jgi:uncharacterized repeat protein (TIGR01451 family)
MAISPARLPGYVFSLILITVGGMFLLSGCSGQANSRKTPDVATSATIPVSSNGIASKETETALFLVIPTTEGQPQASNADLAIEFMQAKDEGLGRKNIYALIVHNLGQSPATDILITDTFPAGTKAEQVHLLQPICQLQENQLVCEVGDSHADSTAAVTLDLSSGTKDYVIPELQLPGLSPNITLPVCSFEQVTALLVRLTCHLKTLMPGSQVQIRMELNPVEPGNHMFSVSAAQVDPDLSNNKGSAAVKLNPVDSAPLSDLTVRAEGPAVVIAGQPFIYTYRVVNQGTQPATGVTFDDPIPPGMRLKSYVPGLPLCDQKGETLTCTMVDPDTGERATFSLTIIGNEQQPIRMDMDPLMPGWPLCYVLNERDYKQILHCDLGALQPGQSTRVRLDMLAIGVQERTTTNTVVVHANEPELTPADNTLSMNSMVQVRSDLLLYAAPPKWSAADKMLSFLIKVKNLGPSAANASILTGALPPGTRIASENLAPGHECQVQADNSFACDLVYLESGETTTLTLVLILNEDFSIQGQAEAFLRSLRGVSNALDPNPDNNIIVGPIVISSEEAK